MNKVYSQHTGKVIQDSRFAHTMALSLNPKTNYSDGLIRCITKRTGEVNVKGYLDISELYLVKELKKYEKYEITEPLNIANSEQILKELSSEGFEFIGLEDPDIIFDQEKNLLHVYFTIPLIDKGDSHSRIYLGHAVGNDLNCLEMTEPVLDVSQSLDLSAKELALAPVNSKGLRLNLVESREHKDGIKYSTVRVAEARSLGGKWEYGSTVIRPYELSYAWCAGHVSPGPFLPQKFINVGKTKLVGFLNGREANKYENGLTKYGIFSVGLFIYDFENGAVEWISKEPIIKDSEAMNITFASQFIQTGIEEGILYAHVDDSFVRAYTIYKENLGKLLF